jgi:hypothetical protein
MPRPLDPDVRDLLTEAVKVLEELPAADRFKVSSALGQVLDAADPTTIVWATTYLRELQRDQGTA